LALVVLLASAGVAHAQDDERPGQARSDYAWGGAGGADRAAEPDDPLRIQAWLGVGVGFRLLRNLDPPFIQDFIAPAFLDFGAAVFLPGGDLRHGVGLGVSTGLTRDQNHGVGPGEQWAFTPSYHLLIPLRRLLDDRDHDLLQLQGRVGVPLVFSSPLADQNASVDFTLGLEVAAGLQVKFLAGLGLYFEVQAGFYGGSQATVHPIISVDGGLFFDYEVLP
jgi:hypothetical protein